MRIGIEAQRIFRKKKGGMDVVAIEIIKSLQKIDKENEYIIYTLPDSEFDNSIWKTDNFKIKYITGLSYFDWEQVSLPLQSGKDKLDVLHCTSNTAPLWGKVPKVVTVHDIIYLEKNSWPVNANWYQRLGNYYRKFVVPRIIKSAQQIVTVSEFEKNNLLNFFNLDESKVKVVHNGVNEVFHKVEDLNLLNKVRAKYSLPDHFIFYLGNTEPRKNIRNLLEAYSLLCSSHSGIPKLVITNIQKEYLDQLLEELGEKKLSDKIILTGYADFKDIPSLYTLSDFFVYPSLREGFGLPILEAMACGTAVVTSNGSSMPEIAGDAALLANPHKPESIAECMKKFISDPLLKASMIQKGLENYKSYTWENSARKLLDIYYSSVKKEYSKFIK